MPPKLGILAGAGTLPVRLIQSCRESGREFFVIAFPGQTPPETVADATPDAKVSNELLPNKLAPDKLVPSERVPHAWVRLGAAGTTVRLLHENGVGEVVMAGAIRKPSVWGLMPDFYTLRLLVKSGALFAGDDGMLSAIVRQLEQTEGFHIVGPDQILGGIVALDGTYGSIKPNDSDQADIASAMQAALEIGERDQGQGAVARSGAVIGLEQADGTNAMLSRISPDLSGARRGVLVKVCKPGQERRVDLPTIGVETVRAADRAGLSGIAVEAGAALVIDADEMTREADAKGMFVVGVPVTPASVPKSDGQRLVYLIAGEASGDALGARLMASIRAQDNSVRFAGVGGDLMQREGLNSLFPMAQLSIMGLAEILPRIPALLSRIRQTVTDIKRQHPDVVVSIDSPGFNYRVAARLQGENIPLVHYVAPTVWAWKPGRAATTARLFDHLLALLPFEPPYFEKEGLPCHFVGHAVLESGADAGDGEAFRKAHGISPDATVLCVLPGSRLGEVSRLMGVFGDVVKRLRQDHPTLSVVVPTVAAVTDAVRAGVALWPGPVTVIDSQGQKYNAFAAADVALAASGTVSLELALSGTAHVIGYRVNPLTAWLLRRMVRVDYASLINILMDRAVVPEYLQGACTAARLTDELARLINDPAARQAQVRDANAALTQLGRGNVLPSDKAAEAVMHILNEQDQ